MPTSWSKEGTDVSVTSVGTGTLVNLDIQNSLNDLAITTSDGGNISVGYNAGANLAAAADNNIFIGKDAGEALATGVKNICIGYNAGSHYTGSNLTAIGYESNSNIASGGAGTFVGMFSGRMKQGVNNTAVGYDAMGYTTASGDGVSKYTDYSPYLGHHNTAIGMDSMFALYDGNYNACIGTMAGFSVNDGSNNFFAGYKAAFGFMGMSSSVIIGANTALAGADESNAIVIGANAIGKGSNKAVIGDDNITDIYLSEDQGATVWLEHINMLEKSSDPAEPAEGHAVIWMSNGSGKGDDGDILIASQAGGSTKYATLFDHSGGSSW